MKNFIIYLQNLKANRSYSYIKNKNGQIENYSFCPFHHIWVIPALYLLSPKIHSNMASLNCLQYLNFSLPLQPCPPEG